MKRVMVDREKSRLLIESLHAEAAAAEVEDDGRAVVLFAVGGSEASVAAESVEVVTSRAFIAPVPRAPAGVVGVASVRGRMRVVVDVGGADVNGSGYLIVLHGDEQVALLVDRVVGVRRFRTDDPDRPRLVSPTTLLES